MTFASAASANFVSVKAVFFARAVSPNISSMPIQLTTFDIDFTAAASAARMPLKAIEQGVLFFDSKIYEEHGRRIGKCTATLLETLQGFIAFMKTQKLTSSQMNEASSAMHRGLCAGSSKAPGHVKNLCSMVWGVLKRRNFELLGDTPRKREDNSKREDRPFFF